MALNVSGHTVDDVSHRLALVDIVGVVVLDGRSVDGSVTAEGQKTLVPVDVTSEVGIDTVLKHEGLECVTNVLLVGRDLGAVHWAVTVDEDPWSLAAVYAGKILGEPVVLLVGLVGVDAAVDVAEWTTVSDECLVLGWEGLVASKVASEWVLWAVWEVGLGVDADEVGKAVVERVPEVADTTTLGTWHAEAVLEGGEVSMLISISDLEV